LDSFPTNLPNSDTNQNNSGGFVDLNGDSEDELAIHGWILWATWAILGIV
jgi:hypothetical protein